MNYGPLFAAAANASLGAGEGEAREALCCLFRVSCCLVREHVFRQSISMREGGNINTKSGQVRGSFGFLSLKNIYENSQRIK